MRGSQWLPLVVVLAWSPGCADGVAPEPTDESSPESDTLFIEVTDELGLPTDAEPWPDGHYLTPEVTPGGVALFDYDNDGDLDLYQVRHQSPDGSFPALGAPAPNRLYEQQDDGTFLDVSDDAGVGDPGYGHGAAVGDIDNDGDLDLYVTNYGPDALYRNEGDGSFLEVTDAAGIVADGWSSSAAFLDYDSDGDLDLYVARFADFDPTTECANPDGNGLSDETLLQEYCGPDIFPGIPDLLFRNDGTGRFIEASAQAGLADTLGGWGVVVADMTGDGSIDIYVANDGKPNLLWVNQDDGTFRDEALTRGVALNGAGNTEAGMGVAVGDADGDGRNDLFMTHFRDETNTLYTGDANHWYRDGSAASGLGAVSLPLTGWGCGFLDFDHDGDLDVVLVNGRVIRGPVLPGAAGSAFWQRYAEPNLVFENSGGGRYTHVPEQAGFSRRVENTRGLAFGDIDSDGDIDLVTNNLDNTLRVFRNVAVKGDRSWLIVRPMVGSRDAYGASVTLRIGQDAISRLAHPAYSYLSSNDPRAHFGVDATSIDAVDIRWPDGSSERFGVEQLNQVVVLTQGAGTLLDGN